MPTRRPTTPPRWWRSRRDIRLVSAKSDRTVEASDFFLDAFTTALEPGEIVLEIQAPVEEANEGYRYEKVAHPASGFAVVGVAARIQQVRRPDRDGADRRHRHGVAGVPRARGREIARKRRGPGEGRRGHRCRRGSQFGSVRRLPIIATISRASMRAAPSPSPFRGRRENRRRANAAHPAGARLRTAARSRGPRAMHAGMRKSGAHRRGRIRHAHEDGAGQRLRPVPGQGPHRRPEPARQFPSDRGGDRARSAS